MSSPFSGSESKIQPMWTLVSANPGGWSPVTQFGGGSTTDEVGFGEGGFGEDGFDTPGFTIPGTQIPVWTIYTLK